MLTGVLPATNDALRGHGHGQQTVLLLRAVRRTNFCQSAAHLHRGMIVCYGPRALCTLTVELPSGTIYVMTLMRSKSGINMARPAQLPIENPISGRGLLMARRNWTRE